MRSFNRDSTRAKRKNLRKNQTEGEMALWQRLRGKRFLGYKFYRQYGIGDYITDFYCPQQKLVIEIDGSQHYSVEGSTYDEMRDHYMCSLGILTIRLSNLEVLQSIDIVLSYIEQELRTPPQSPSLLKRGK